MKTTTTEVQNGVTVDGLHPDNPFTIELRLTTSRAVWSRLVSIPILPYSGLKVQIYSHDGTRAEETLGDIVIDERSGQLYTWLTDGETKEYDELEKEILSYIGWGFQLWADGMDFNSREDTFRILESMAATGELKSIRYGYYNSIDKEEAEQSESLAQD